MHGDGNGWVQCDRGHQHWGRHGAAGLLLHTVDDDGIVRVLLQHRAAWSHHGDTWGLPGGARDSHEDATAAALREAAEEAGVDLTRVRARHASVEDHGGWSYTTVYADTPTPLATTPTHESAALAWLALDEVARRPLHPGFAATWPGLRPDPVVLLVDTANVVGSRPDGWWRDRVGATTRLLTELAALRAVTARSTQDTVEVIASVVAVVEGAAAAARGSAWVRVVGAPTGGGASGDDVLVRIAAELVSDDRTVLAVTADRALRSRLERLTGPSAHGSVQSVGPRWLRALLDESRRPQA
jgi:8-oxo-dGTP pyrophosphatase MutT (NUDIX family)